MNPGDLISGKYRLQRQLGSGGMGSVWAARNELTEREFAVKFLLPSLASNEEALQRFFLEARACGRIKHPAVVEVYDVGQADDGSPFLVMELLEGEGLDRRVLRSGPLDPADAAAYIAFVARGLQEAHVRGVIHRDLKPGNIFLSVDALGEIVPKVLDFGISKATRPGSDHFTTTSGVVVGSPAYMSPEQARGDTEIDGRSDVWALGIILYQALTGAVPFEAPNYNALMVSILNAPHRPLRERAPHVPADLAAIVDRALIKDKGKRIGTARELAERLEAVLATMQLSRGKNLLVKASSPADPMQRAQAAQSERAIRRLRSRVRLLRTAVLLLIAATVTAGAALLVPARRPPVVLAARSSSLFTMVLARMKAHAAELEAKAAAEARAKAEQLVQQAAASSSEPPPPAPSAGPIVSKPGQSPHGGVESPGF